MLVYRNLATLAAASPVCVWVCMFVGVCVGVHVCGGGFVCLWVCVWVCMFVGVCGCACMHARVVVCVSHSIGTASNVVLSLADSSYCCG